MEGYWVDEYGVVYEKGECRCRYDGDYVCSRYESEDMRRKTEWMAWLRAGWIFGVMEGVKGEKGGPLSPDRGEGNESCHVRRLLDVGYGNGAFLRVMRELGWECYGTDVSGVAVPEGCGFVEWNEVLARRWDLVTFFDSLEHFEDLGFLRRLQAEWVVVTAPWCHYAELGEEWFMEWKHRRPGEHLHHFSPESLGRMMEGYGWQKVARASIEDGIRKGDGVRGNTFTSVFRRG